MSVRIIIATLLLLCALQSDSQSAGVILDGQMAAGVQAVASVQPPAGMNVWYSADCITYASSVCGTPTTGTAITAWADRSGNANNLTRTAGTCTFNSSQVNAKPAVTFAACGFSIGTGIGPGGGTWTIFSVLKDSATGTGYAAFLGGTTGTLLVYSGGSAQKQQSVDIQGVATFTGTAAQTTTWHQGNLVFKNYASGNSFAFRLDRAADGSGIPGTGNNATSANTTVGNATPTYQLAELIYYNSALTSTQITQVETYLNNKYGL